MSMALRAARVVAPERFSTVGAVFLGAAHIVTGGAGLLGGSAGNTEGDEKNGLKDRGLHFRQV